MNMIMRTKRALSQRFHERVAYGQEAQFLLGDGFLAFVTRGQTAQRPCPGFQEDSRRVR